MNPNLLIFYTPIFLSRIPACSISPHPDGSMRILNNNCQLAITYFLLFVLRFSQIFHFRYLQLLNLTDFEPKILALQV
jgi:hypothetical protein